MREKKRSLRRRSRAGPRLRLRSGKDLGDLGFLKNPGGQEFLDFSVAQTQSPAANRARVLAEKRGGPVVGGLEPLGAKTRAFDADAPKARLFDGPEKPAGL